MSTDKCESIVHSCLQNAGALIDSAKLLHSSGKHSHAYHLAALSLEETGKAVLVRVSYVTHEKSQEKIEEWQDNHLKKLFWALWSPMFGKELPTRETFEDIHEIGRSVHRNRLASLYVSPSNGAVFTIPADKSKQLIDLAEARLAIEQQKTFGEIDEKGREQLAWFMRASEHPVTKAFIFSEQSFRKLQEMGGSPRTWIAWLMEQIEHQDKETVDFLKQELTRDKPAKEVPRWKFKTRLRSDSHSFRQKELNDWNSKITFVQLSSNSPEDLTLEVTLPSRVRFESLWDIGLHMHHCIIGALNMGTSGFFWWYLPERVSKYYDLLHDLETQRHLEIGLNPKLRVNWIDKSDSDNQKKHDDGKKGLKAEDFRFVGLVFTYLMRLKPDQWPAAAHYVRALSLMAKNDIFLRLEANVLEEFYLSLKALGKLCGWWDGESNFLHAALAHGDEWTKDDDFERVMTLAHQAAAHDGSLKEAITLSEAAAMKIYCDVAYIKAAADFMSAHRAI